MEIKGAAAAPRHRWMDETARTFRSRLPRSPGVSYRADIVNPEQALDPYAVFDAWLAEAEAQGLALAESMVLATVDADGRPSARVVLYKGRSHGGFRFFTNYQSRKARELDGNSAAAVVFHWPTLTRQIRIEGQVEQLEADESDAYFATRPRESQLGAWASPQSSEVTSRADLDARYARVEARFAGTTVSRPPHWGGYRLVPSQFEFWVGQQSRMHDRIVFVRSDSDWIKTRLGP